MAVPSIKEASARTWNCTCSNDGIEQLHVYLSSITVACHQQLSYCTCILHFFLDFWFGTVMYTFTTKQKRKDTNLRKMKRFWRKKAIPCHQWGKPGGHDELGVDESELSVVLQSSVTAWRKEMQMNIHVHVDIQCTCTYSAFKKYFISNVHV